MGAGDIHIRSLGAICLRGKEGSRLRHSASLNSLMVAQSHQRAGIGRLLTAHLIGFEPFGLEPDAIHHEGRYRAIHHLHLSLVSSDCHEQPIS